MPKKNIPSDVPLPDLRHRAEERVKAQAFPETPDDQADAKRLLHELQVHQIELELQNTELKEARNETEVLLATYTDLFDFAPIGYLSITEKGQILEVNLTAASLLGVDRSHLIHKRFQDFVDSSCQKVFLSFLDKVFSDSIKHVCQIPLMPLTGKGPFWADLHATVDSSLRFNRRWCRMAVSDFTFVKQAEEAKKSLEEMAASNKSLKDEIVRREEAESDLKKSQGHYVSLYEQSLQMQEQLRHLSRQLLVSQEEERKRISRELHDEVVQTLVGIRVHLDALTLKAPVNLRDFRKKISSTQRLVEKSVTIVHRFARELRPTVLDDLGIVSALQSFIKDFTKRTRLNVQLTAYSAVEELSSTQRTVLYRVAQAALANVHKHAKATEVKISILSLPKTIRLEIHDNGKSFDVEAVFLAKRHKRLGLLGSRERVEMIGGTFSIFSSPEDGTKVRADIPVDENMTTNEKELNLA